MPNEARREDARALCALLADWTGEPPVMWGSSIVGFGTYRHRHESGHEGDAALVAFAPRSTPRRCASWPSARCGCIVASAGERRR